MAQVSPFVEHLLRRAGFGVSEEERERFSRYTYPIAVSVMTNYDPAETDVDDKIDTPGYLPIGGRGFSPNLVLNDARKRWLFRMVHSPAPLQERMALLWHHHFATAHSKISDLVGTTDATRLMAAKPSDDPGRARGQIELFRQNALGNFRELLVEVAKDPAMLYWLDGRLNRKGAPQENFGRELMELFTVGVEHYVETDVYAAARVFTGWNLTQTGTRGTASAFYSFNYNPLLHDTEGKEFSFPIYRNGSGQIPARSAAAGIQDGLDLISALATHPETARRMARRLWTWFVSETEAPDPVFVENIANVYLRNDTNMKPVIRAVLLSPQFTDPDRFHQRYSWPVEFVVRMFKEVGYVGASLDAALTPLLNMGQQLLEPPDVNGWELGPGWFTTGGMLARMNFAAALTTNQRILLRDAARAHRQTPETLLDFAIDRLSLPEIDPEVRNALLDYIRGGLTWTGDDAQLGVKTAGVIHLLTGSGDYQFV